MRKSRFTEEQLIAVLKESQAGAATKELCRRHGISEQTLYRWKSKYGGMKVSEAIRPHTSLGGMSAERYFELWSEAMASDQSRVRQRRLPFPSETPLIQDPT